MNKKVLAVLTSLLVFTMGSLTVSAASPATDTTAPVTVTVAQETTTSTATEVTVGGETVKIEPTVTADNTKNTEVTNAVKALDMAAVGKAIGSDAIAKAAADKDAKIEAKVVSVVDVAVDAAVVAQCQAAGVKIPVTLNIASVSTSKNYIVLHYTNGAWETLVPSVANGKLTVEVSSFSPFAVVEVAVASAGTGSTGSTSGTVTSPKTGETTSMVTLMAMICLAGVLVCGKKVKFN